MFCAQPFYSIEIYDNGDVSTCCPFYINDYKIGNIFKSSFDEIWNGEKAKEFRHTILNGEFNLCNNFCNRKALREENTKNYKEIVEKYPEEISISSDNVCNVKCRICRDENFHTNFDKETLNDEIENIWLPIFKDAKIVRFGCSGEPFASYKETLIIKKAAEKYPNLKFHFHTNGILADEHLLKELKVFDKIHTITVSLHSAHFWTYNKVVRGGNWNKVNDNLKFYSKMKENNLINHFRMIFCVYSENYKDMPAFVKLAKKHNATAEFWALRQNDVSEVGQNYEKYSLINPRHKHHKDLIKILRKPIFRENNVILYPELKNLIK